MSLPGLQRIRERIAILAVAMIGASALVGCAPTQSSFHAKDITGVLPRLEFQLTSGSGRNLTAADLRGKTTLLYFGYTQCPDACPMTLTYISAALKQLGAEEDRVRVLFVSVDPQRDTPEVLKRYVTSFGPQVIGLTGSDAQLTSVTRRYRVAYRRDPPNSDGDYAVYHSSAVFVFDGQGRARLLATPSSANDGLAEDLRALIGPSHS